MFVVLFTYILDNRRSAVGDQRDYVACLPARLRFGGHLMPAGHTRRMRTAQQMLT